MPFTPEELEAMRLADEEIEREFTERYVADQVDKEISAWLDELAYLESLDHKAAARFKRQKKYSAAYYAEHKEEIAAYQAAYRAEHMPRSFVEQAMARCSVPGSKFWFNCNPDGPQHWFYLEWVLKAKERNALHLHFTMADNLALAPEIRKRYESMYSGVFYRRYIQGEWCKAEGLVYAIFNKDWHVTDKLPEYDRRKRSRYQFYISIDYGTLNPFSAGLWCLYDGVAYRMREFYHNGRVDGMKTDSEYYSEIERLARDLPIESIIIDPSAASMITEIQRRGRFTVRKAQNDVIPGISYTAALLQAGRLKIGSTCTDAVREFGLYAWDEKVEKDRVIKENDHAMDDMRYFAYTILRREFLVEMGDYGHVKD